MLKVDLDLGPVMRKLDGIEAAIKASVRKAAAAGAEVLYNEVRTRALTIGGSKRLQASIYQKFVIDSKGGALGESATYHISWRKQRAKTNVKGEANPEAGLPHTTIGFWIEFGRWQRYMVRTDKNGEWYTVARPEMKGKPKPKYNAPQAQKDAYWMPRNGGPVFHPAKSFLRSGYDAAKADAVKAAQARMKELIQEYLK